eukprot:GFUD01018312.1.p1 GENE.GFUD01018312.1~~GFUD01018312.1.p1  ORF type:complete len:1199 (+),score=288.84 GFUD01018312.1:311-3598(+)
MSMTGMTMQGSYAIASFPPPSSASSRKCEMCPSPSPFPATDHGTREIHLASHQPVKFLCAACGQRMVEYEDMVKHVESDHVGDDQELVRASIVIPDNIHLLKTFQCGIKSCGRKLVGLTELDLKEHIRRNHGEFYIHMGQGRNLVRLCRLCPSTKFVSDQALTEHLQQTHPLALFANMESNEILPAVVLSSSSRKPVLRDTLSEREDRTGTEVRGSSRERLDVWYFRDQNRTENRASGASRRDESSHATDMNKYSRDIENPSRIKPSFDRKPRKRLNIISHEGFEHRESKQKLHHGESQRFSMSPSEPSRKGDKIDLKYKLKKIRESKNISLARVFCQACNSSTREWPNHKFSLQHTQNNKKARCLYCPKRLWFSQLKSHVVSAHKGCSFSCNVSSSCLVRLMDLEKLTDHINEKHREQVEHLCQQFGKNWQSWYVSSHHLAKSNFFLLPSDLRKLSCRLCGLRFLGQAQEALELHFQLEHSDLSSSRYKATTLYECRACDGMLFGSESYLLEHFTQVHAEAGLSINRESEEERSRRPCKETINRKRRYSETSNLVFQHKELKEKGDRRENSLNIDKPFYRYRRQRSFEEVMEDVRHGEEEVLLNSKCGRETSRTKHCEEPSNKWGTERSCRKRRNSEVVVVDQPRNSNSRANYLSSDGENESQSPDEDTIEICPFCDKKTIQSRLLVHMKKKHKNNLFSCNGSCAKKFRSAWKSVVILHLKTVHNLKLNDSMLSCHHLSLPDSLAMICCKVPGCYKTIFLGRHLEQVEKFMSRHVEKFHKGKLVDCFNLACRSCSSVFSVDEAADWEEHLAQDHTKILSSRPRSRTDSSSIMDVSVPWYDRESEERSVRLVSRPSSLTYNAHEDTNVARTMCKFCGEMVEEEKEAEHELSLHLARLFSCQICQKMDERWFGQTALELVSHTRQEHKIDMKFEDFPAPEDQDTSLSICSVCQTQFYSKDPAMLATHLLEHDLGPNMGLYMQLCRICYSMKGDEDPIKDLDYHNQEVHSIKTLKNSRIKVEEDQESKPKVKEYKNKKVKSEDSECQPCPYCGDSIDRDKISFHVSTQHRKSTFRCTICVESKMSTTTTTPLLRYHV